MQHKAVDAIRNRIESAGFNAVHEAGLLKHTFTVHDGMGSLTVRLKLLDGRQDVEIVHSKGSSKSKTLYSSVHADSDRRAIGHFQNALDDALGRLTPPPEPEVDLTDAIRSLIDADPETAAELIAKAVETWTETESRKFILTDLEEALTATPSGPGN